MSKSLELGKYFNPERPGLLDYDERILDSMAGHTMPAEKNIQNNREIRGIPVVVIRRRRSAVVPAAATASSTSTSTT